MFNIQKIVTILPLLFWQIAFFFIPFLLLLYNSFFGESIIDILQWLFKYNFFNIIFETFYKACTISFICLLIAYLVAYCISQKNKNVQFICLLIFFIPFITNSLIHLLAIINLFYKNGLFALFINFFSDFKLTKSLLYNNFLVNIGYIYCYIPYMFVPLYNAISKFDNNLLIASADLGASFWRSIFKILIPSTKNAIINGFFLVFVAASGEFLILEILGGDKYMNAGGAIYYALISSNLIQHSMVMVFLFTGILLITSYVLYNLLLLLFFYLKKI